MFWFSAQKMEEHLKNLEKKIKNSSVGLDQLFLTLKISYFDSYHHKGHHFWSFKVCTCLHWFLPRFVCSGKQRIKRKQYAKIDVKKIWSLAFFWTMLLFCCICVHTHIQHMCRHINTCGSFHSWNLGLSK